VVDASASNPPLRPIPPRCSGRVALFSHQASRLAGNPLGDPVARRHPVYLPPGYDQDQRRYPVVWCLAPYTNAGPGQVAWRNHGENVAQRIDRLIATGRMAPVIAVFPDCYTSLGGNQYVDSLAIGDYASYLVDELVPAVDAAFRTLAEPAHRALFGKSSGGFGALHLAMTRPGHFAGIASHAADCGFERVYLRDFPLCCGVLERFYGDPAAFVQAFWRENRPPGNWFHALMTLCLAASYSPQPDAPLGMALPFDLRTCRLDETVWARWLAFDPLNRVADAAGDLRSLKGLWIDAGNRDQYFIHYGTRELHDRLSALDIGHHYEEFDGSHSGIDWRLDHSLPWLVERIY